MKRTLIALTLILCLLTGCGNGSREETTAVPAETDVSAETSVPAETASAEASEPKVTFTDDLGREISLDRPGRTAALLGSYADMWISAGGTVCASADDAWDDFHLSLSEDAVNLGATKKLSLESLLGSAPDFVLASSNSSQHLEFQSALEGAGIPVAYFSVQNFQDYLRVFRICTDILGTPDAYEKYGTQVAQRIDTILSQHQDEDPQSVLVLRASASFIRAKNSEGTVLGGVLKDFGCVNLADSDSSLLENLNVESIAVSNPDKIFLVQSGDDAEGTKENVEKMFAENPLWQELDAVKNGHLYYMDKSLFNLKPNARWAESYEQAAEILYGK